MGLQQRSGILQSGRKKTLAIANTDPLGALDTKIKQYQNEMTSGHIAEQLEWSIEKVDEVFPPAVRNQIWASRRDPKTVIARIAELLEETCTTPVIAKAVGWDIEQVDEVFSSADRVRVFKNCKDPIAKFRHMARSFDRLTPEYIAKLTGWHVLEVKDVFLPHQIKKRLDLKNPDAFIKAMAKRYKTILSDENLTQTLNLTLPQVKALFPPSRKIRLAVHTAKNLSRKLPDIVQLNIELSRTYELPPSITGTLAHRSRDLAHKTARTILKDLVEKPTGITDTVWIWQRLNMPSATREMRIKTAQAWMKFQGVISLDQGRASHSLHDIARTADGPGSPNAEDIFMTMQPDDYLQSLATKANVSSDQLLALLQHFQNGDMGDLGSLESVLKKLTSLAWG
jgi:hypothetical protein